MDQGPYEVGKTIIVECSIERIYPTIPKTAFNVTFEQNNKIFTSKVVSVSAGISKLKIDGSFKSSMEFDNDTVICQVTTSGHYYKEEKHLRIYSKLIALYPALYQKKSCFTL